MPPPPPPTGRRRRAVAAALAGVSLLVSACSPGERTEPLRPPPSTAGAPPRSASTTVAPDRTCRGLGEATAAGEVTWIEGRTLRDRNGCLVALERPARALAWGGKGDRAVVGDAVLVAAGTPLRGLGEGRLSLSRPTGTSLLQLTDDGKLLKRELTTGRVRELRVLARHEAAVYHPAGRHIVASGRDDAGQPALVIADNEGGDVRPLLGIEEASAIAAPVFTASGALLYVADHGDRVDLHRLELGGTRLSTVASVRRPATIADVTASPFAGGGVAWTAGDCASGRPLTLVAQRGGRFLPVAGTEAEHARPVGWLPDGALVAVANRSCEPTVAGRLVVVRPGSVEVVADGVTAAAVRAVLPPPPPPPRDIPQQAPA